MPDPISWSHAAPYLMAALVFGYLLGSIPTGVILTRLAGTKDLRSVGSGNIGATNVLRTGRKDLAALTLLGDLLKGLFAVLIATRFGPDTAVAAGLGAFLGHLYPVWLKFKGGKGVATYGGILLASWWPAGLAGLVIWLSVAAVTRYSSLAALVAATAVPLILAAVSKWQLAELFAVLSILLFWKHRDNIGRLLRGQENKIGKKA